MPSKRQTQYIQKLYFDISEVTVSGAISSEFTKFCCQYIKHFSASLWVRNINRDGQIWSQERVDFSSAKPDTSVGHDPDPSLSASAQLGDERTMSPADDKHCHSGLAENKENKAAL